MHTHANDYKVFFKREQMSVVCIEEIEKQVNYDDDELEKKVFCRKNLRAKITKSYHTTNTVREVKHASNQYRAEVK